MSDFSAPRDDLTRSLPFTVDRASEDGDGLTLEGYAAVWDSPTEINSRHEGHFIERIKPGAFKRTLNAKMPVLMFNHGQHPLIGDMPLGKIEEAREDARGLFIRARLSDNWLIQPVRDAIAAEAVSGMSFRMSIPEGGETWRRGKGLPERDITEIKCYECGPVVFPAYEETTAGVRSRDVIDRLAEPDVRADLARALFMADAGPFVADEEPHADEARDAELVAALQLVRDAIAAGDVDSDLVQVTRDTVAEIVDPADEVTPHESADSVTETTPDEARTDSTDEVTPVGATPTTDAETARFLRQLKARDLLGA